MTTSGLRRTRRSRSTFAAIGLVAVLAMLAGACGSRADSRQVAEALGRTAAAGRSAALATGSTGDQAGAGDATSTGDASAGDAATTATGASTGGATAGGTTGGGTTGGGSTGAGTATAAPAGGNGGATDVGVTADSITLANVSILTGPVPGLFAGAAYGTDAFLQYQNSLGGVFGRKLKLLIGDDGFDCGKNRAITDQYASKAFAFVGSFSLYDNCGADVFNKTPTLPDVHNALSSAAQKEANNFSPQPIRAGMASGPINYFKSKFPNSVTNCASLVGDVDSAKGAWVGEKWAMDQSGWKFSYERLYSPTETDFTSDIVRMRTGSVKCVVLIAADAKSIGRILAAAQQQNWKPDFWMLGASAYDVAMLKLAGSAAEGAYVHLPVALYLGEDEGVNPEVKLFLTWLKKTHPDSPIDLFAAYGWSSARLFVQALQAAGPKATRASLLAELKKIDNFTANGLLPAAGPASKRPPSCYVITQVKGGKFQRVDSPPPGFRCDGQYLFAPGA